MSTLAESVGQIKKPWRWIAAGAVILLIWSAVTLPNLRMARPTSPTVAMPAAEYYSVATTRAKLAMSPAQTDAMKMTPASASAQPSAMTDRKIIRTSSLEMVVQHPEEVAERIAGLVERLGGYIESSEGGGQSATAGAMSIRVPAARFDEARLEIRKLGLRVESEKVQGQDVTRQYVDQEASIRNLRAEEAQYLAILKQAGTVKDLLAVSEKLSEVRGQIEQQQAEFDALSKQTETVAIVISLRTEAEAQVFGLNWRPGYQMKMALRDGLESLAIYATAMATILFYLPTVLLWVGTILAGIVISWKVVLWVGRRWFGWKSVEAAAS